MKLSTATRHRPQRGLPSPLFCRDDFSDAITSDVILRNLRKGIESQRRLWRDATAITDANHTDRIIGLRGIFGMRQRPLQPRGTSLDGDVTARAPRGTLACIQANFKTRLRLASSCGQRLHVLPTCRPSQQSTWQAGSKYCNLLSTKVRNLVRRAVLQRRRPPSSRAMPRRTRFAWHFKRHPLCRRNRFS